jgi:hypothetical protein
MSKINQLCVGLMLVALCVAPGAASASTTFNGQGENQTASLGYYYAVAGGKFVNGQTADGTANGRTIRFIQDEPDWGRAPSELDQWQKDSFFSDTAGVALTLKNGASTVYDNNGIEDGSFATNYYNAQAGSYPTGGHGAVVLYSMSNNFDWIYAGYMKVTEATTITSLTGYFLTNTGGDNGTVQAGFDPSNPNISYRMNIFSSLTGGDPNVREVTNTGSFTGDVFSTDNTGGTFAFSDTGYDRVGGSGLVSSVYRLTYTLDTPMVLQPGEYFFSHDAAVPEPTGIALLGLGLGALLLRRRRRMA